MKITGKSRIKKILIARSGKGQIAKRGQISNLGN
jgi:hypothetical protein